MLKKMVMKGLERIGEKSVRVGEMTCREEAETWRVKCRTLPTAVFKDLKGRQRGMNCNIYIYITDVVVGEDVRVCGE